MLVFVNYARFSKNADIKYASTFYFKFGKMP